jgi:hypothetical protein
MGTHRVSETTEKRLREWLTVRMRKEGFVRSYTFDEAVSELLNEVRLHE